MQVLPIQKGDFRAELIQVSFQRLGLQRGQESMPRVLHGYVRPERAVIGFLTDADQPGHQHCGMQVSPPDIIFNSSHTMHRKTQAASRWGSMSLAVDEFAAVSKSLVGRELSVPAVSCLVRPASESFARLLKLHEVVVYLAKSMPEILANREVSNALENELIEAMVQCLDGGNPVVMTQKGRNHWQILKRLEEYLAENLLQPLYVADICAATDATERLLRACCQEYLGMSPTRYLWLRRMHLARRALALGTPETSSVTQIATDNGFWELGRFSVEYRSLFGESPSATLKRPA